MKKKLLQLYSICIIGSISLYAGDFGTVDPVMAEESFSSYGQDYEPTVSIAPEYFGIDDSEEEYKTKKHTDDDQDEYPGESHVFFAREVPAKSITKKSKFDTIIAQASYGQLEELLKKLQLQSQELWEKFGSIELQSTQKALQEELKKNALAVDEKIEKIQSQIERVNTKE